jgi:peptidoglycan/xylan/chitin deacetylase (PgdA/CDA1 family)
VPTPGRRCGSTPAGPACPPTADPSERPRRPGEPSRTPATPPGARSQDPLRPGRRWATRARARGSGGVGVGRAPAPTRPRPTPGPDRWICLVSGALLLVLLAAPAQAASAPQQCAAGSVRLTFDDGPDATATPDVLDTLAERGVEATFFVTGQMTAARPDIVRRASQEGHRIGNHSWSHPRLTTLDRAQVESQLRRTNEVIEQATGSSPREWRPPYGATSDLVAAAAREVGLDSMVLWTVDPRDWADPPATTIRDRVLQGVRPGSVVLLHDATGQNTPAALPMILDGLAERGYCTQ